MIYCSKCGKPQDPQAKRCPDCGAKIKASKKERKAALAEARQSSGRVLGQADDSTVNALGFEAMYPNGTCRISEGLYSRSIEFQDANFQAARQVEQEDIFNRYCELLNSFDATVSVKVSIVTQAVNEDAWKQQMFLAHVEGDEVGNHFRDEMNSMIDLRMTETHQNVRRTRFMTLTVKEPTREKADPVLSRAVENAIRNLKVMGVEARELSGKERLDVINSITNPEDPIGSTEYRSLADQPGLTTRDLVAPPYFERNAPQGATACSWGRCFGACLYLEKYATTVRSDTIAKLAELPINQIITLNMDCWDQAEAMETIEQNLTDIKVQKTEYVLKHSQQMYISDEMLPSDLQDALVNAEQLRDDLVARDQKYWQFSMSVLTWSDNEKETQANVDEIQGIIRQYNMRMEVMKGLQLEGYKNSLPTGYNGIPAGWDYNMATASMAAFIPLTSVEIMDPGGMWLGMNTVSKNFIFYDRLKSNSPNAFYLGKPGRGKSVTAKLQIINTLLKDPTAEIIVLDPEREYQTVAAEMGGEDIIISGSSPAHINPFDLTIDHDDNGGGLSTKVDAIMSIVDKMSGGMSETQKTLVDRTCTQIYADYFDSRNPMDVPTLKVFSNTLRAQPEPDGAMLATAIERYVSGQSAVFSHMTNVNTHSRFVVYDIHDLGENMQSLGLFILLDNVWQRIVRNRDRGVRTWVFIDELQLLLDNKYTIDYFDRLWTRSRKYGAIPTGITQNVERLLEVPQTRFMVSNSDHLIILGQSPADAERLGEDLGLSMQQISTIRSAGVGEGLIVADGRIVPFKNTLPRENDLYRITTTKVDDLAAQRQTKTMEIVDAVLAQGQGGGKAPTRGRRRTKAGN